MVMDLQAQVPGGARSAHRQPCVSGVIEALEVRKQTLAPSLLSDVLGNSSMWGKTLFFKLEAPSDQAEALNVSVLAALSDVRVREFHFRHSRRTSNLITDFPT